MKTDAACSGLYEIRHAASGKRYIGSTADFARRWCVHRSYLKHGQHHNAHLQAAWNKYGSEAFQFSVVMLCPPEGLLHWEQKYLDEFKPEYNAAKVAGSILGLKLSPERIAKAAAARRGKGTGPQSPEWIESRAKHCRGKKQTPEHVEKRVASLRGRKMPPHSAEHRAKIAAGCKAYHSFKKERQCH